MRKALPEGHDVLVSPARFPHPGPVAIVLHEREATADDYALFLRFWDQLEIDQTPPSARYWVKHVRRDIIFLDVDRTTVAYALCRPYGARGDIRQIVVDPAWRRRGVGLRLMEVVRARLQAAGCTSWALEVKESNTPAIALYHRAGMRELARISTLRADRDTLARWRSQRSPDVRVTPAGPADDQALEATFRLLPGHLARLRASRPHEPVFQLHRSTTLAGMARWWPEIQDGVGLLFPFEAQSVGQTGALVDVALSTGIPSNLREVELFVRTPRLAQDLLTAGARIHERFLEMGGPLTSALQTTAPTG
jgi:ribosomal protein S18 acetylase RimI-like enzyme